MSEPRLKADDRYTSLMRERSRQREDRVQTGKHEHMYCWEELWKIQHLVG